MWEEPSLCVKKGVTAIFFSGCNLKCNFCQNQKISKCDCGEKFTIEEFALLLKELDGEETDGLDFVSPTQFTSLILKAFEIYKPKHKVIWNSNGYEKPEKLESISPFVDVFLPDFKYYDDALALNLSSAPKYREICEKAILKMAELKPNIMDNIEMKQGVIVRHLVLPDETKDSINVLKSIHKNFPNVYVSLMSQFVPNGQGDKLRKITPLEYKIVVSTFKKLGLKNGFIQELNSSSEAFIPNFWNLFDKKITIIYNKERNKGVNMTGTKKLTLLKLEGFLFAAASIFFMVMFYFNYISKYFLCSTLLMFSAVLFSINVSLQQNKGNKPMEKLNIFLSALFFIAALGFSIYCYATGLITF